MKLFHLRAALLGTVAIWAGIELISAEPLMAQTGDPAVSAYDDGIVVTARKRDESLISVPVVVSAQNAETLARYKADDLGKIGELTPTVIVGTYKANGGGSIAIRGISSPANQTGFEQAVSVALDGVQTSNGRIAQLGFFDVQQVEVLKGPQALFFGKNSPAGVISVHTADPTPSLEAAARASYEFVANEVTTEASVSGPLSESLGGRVAVRFRKAEGWLRNLAQPMANPFYTATAPIGASQLPGTADPRPGDEEFLGRVTLALDPSDDFKAKLKLFGAWSKDAGAGVASQNIGPCTGPNPRVSGVADPYGECVIDDRTTVGDVPETIGRTMKGISQDSRARGKLSAFISSLALDKTFDGLTLSSLTGFNTIKYNWFSGLDQTTLSQLAQFEGQKSDEYSQEIRLTSDFDTPLNFMIGAYYQKASINLHQDVKLNDRNYNPAADRYVSFETFAKQKGRTISAFAQIMYDISDTLELAGGARWTKERKRFRKNNVYGISVFNTLATVYPGSDEVGVLKGRFSDDNISPEATLTWRPDADHTVFLAYKTGYKSGGFGLTNPLQTSTQISAVDFGSEKARGFELGAKGLFLDNRLRLSFAAFAYRFSDLQVNTYDPSLVAYTIDNAGKVRQRGAELEWNFRGSDILSLHGAIAYVRNRFKDFTGQCYGYTFPTGSVRATAVPPPNCSFVNTTNLTLQQVFDGRAPARSPDWSGNAGFVFDIPLGGLKLGITGDAFYSDGYYAAETMAASTYQKDFWKFNASVSLAQAEDRWTLSLIGRNLSNKYYLLYAADRTGGTGVPGAIGEQRGVVSRGREVVLQAGVKF